MFYLLNVVVNKKMTQILLHWEFVVYNLYFFQKYNINGKCSDMQHATSPRYHRHIVVSSGLMTAMFFYAIQCCMW